MTNFELKVLRNNYKIFWGKIHQKKYSEIAFEVGKTMSSINMVIYEYFPYLHSHRRRKGSTNSNGKPYKISEVCLHDLLREGFNQSEVAKTCGCSRQAISDRIKRKNLYWITDKNLDVWRRYTKAYQMRLQGIKISDIQKQTKIGYKEFYKFFPELKTKGLGYRPYKSSYLGWFRPEVLAWQTKAYWYKIQGLTIKEIMKRLGKSRELIGALTQANPEIKLPVGSWKYKYI